MRLHVNSRDGPTALRALPTPGDGAHSIDHFRFRQTTDKHRFSLLVEANKTLAACSDQAEARSVAARLAVSGALSDYCFVDLIEVPGLSKHANGGGDSIDRLALIRTPGEEGIGEGFRELGCSYLYSTNRSHGTPRALRTGRPELVSKEIGEGLLEDIACDKEHLRILRRLDPGSYMCVPLRVDRETIGAMGFVSASAVGRYGEEDLALAEGLAGCVSLAMVATLRRLSAFDLAQELARFVKQAPQAANPPIPKEAPKLSPRQTEMLVLLDRGASASVAAQKMGISEETVRSHTRSIRRAFGACSKQEALEKARELGLLPPLP